MAQSARAFRVCFGAKGLVGCVGPGGRRLRACGPPWRRGCAGWVVLAMLVASAGCVRPREQEEARVRQPDVLGSVPVAGVFGSGTGVDWPAERMKVFVFEVALPIRAIVVLHFFASHLAEGELFVSVNGAELSAVAPDTGEPGGREVEILVPPQVLRSVGANEFVLHREPGVGEEDGWRVWEPRVELLPLPELPARELVARSDEELMRGYRLLEDRWLGPDRLFRAWRSFREAWIDAVAVPAPGAVARVGRARSAMEDAAAKLEALCRHMLLSARRSAELGERVAAEGQLKEIARYFPTADNTCRRRAAQRLKELGR